MNTEHPIILIQFPTLEGSADTHSSKGPLTEKKTTKTNREKQQGEWESMQKNEPFKKPSSIYEHSFQKRKTRENQERTLEN